MEAAAATSTNRRCAIDKAVDLHRLIHALPTGIVIWHRTAGFRFANTSALAFLGLSPAELRACPNPEALFHILRPIAADGRPIQFSDSVLLHGVVNGQSIDSEIRAFSQSPNRWFLVNCSPTPGDPLQILISLTDITARISAEQLAHNLVRGISARIGLDYLRGLVRHLADTLGAQFALIGEYLAKDREFIRCHALYADHQFLENVEYDLKGTPCENVIGRFACVYPAGVQELFPHDAMLQDLHVQSYAGLPLFSSAGQALGLIAVMWKQPLASPDIVEPILSVFAERAAAELERRRYEEDLFRYTRELESARRELQSAVEQLQQAHHIAEAANAAKSAFLATLSHEIRTPLHTILGTAQLLDSPANPAEVRRDADSIHNAAHTLLTLINDLLDLSRLETGRIELETSPVSLAGLISATIRLFENQAAQKNLRLDYSLDPLLPPTILADSMRLQQILNNLVGNAVKFTPAGAVHIACTAHNNHLRIDISDTGIGVPPSAVSSIFSPFSQADPSYARRYGGSGLGLAICKRLVEAMHGAIGYDPAPSGGSTFWVQIPLQTAPVSPVTTPPYAAMPQFPGRHVLIVEDNLVNQRVAQRMLQRMSIATSTAGNGSHALELCNHSAFDAILMDCQMPEMDGLETTRSLRLAGLRCPIIAMTANAFAGEREHCLAAGMDDYLSKPVDIHQLATTLQRWLTPSRQTS